MAHHVFPAAIVCCGGLVLVLLCGARASAQIYQPPDPYSMWDTWLFPDGDEFHLFFLQSEPGITWNALGRAVSKDLLHWTVLPSIPTQGPEGAWDRDPTLTGMTVKRGGQYYTFYGSATHGQKIGLMTSPDLGHWEKHPGNPLLEVTPPHYAGSDWRDMCTFYEPNEDRWHGYVCAQTGDAGPKLPLITDKTLVAWVSLANTDQRGGSVLTLDHGNPPGDAFDGIVFGEKMPGKWMPGSDGFRRTQDDQTAYPLETSGSDALIQMAIVYAGKQVTVYRNGEVYASYPIEPVQFGDGTAVVMGLRHLGAGAQSGRYFAGAIEEARLYNVALDAAAIRALAPGQASEPKPLAQWTFDDGPVDAMGTFPPGELRGGARVADGKLYLNGVDGCLVTPTRAPKTCIAHLVSKDLVAWDYLPPAFADPDFVDMEVPDYFELNGRHYLLFSSARSRKDTSGRTNASGTWYVMAEDRDGPYHVPDKPLLLGSGRGRFDNYVGRTIPWGDGRMLYHHTVGGPVTWGVPKRVRQHEDGTLWLEYWPGLAKIETKALFEGTDGLDTADVWNRDSDGTLTRPAEGGRALLWLPVSAGDVMITCGVRAEASAMAGVLWRLGDEKGAGLLLEDGGKKAAVVTTRAEEDGLAWDIVDDCTDLPSTDGVTRVRVLVRAHRVEVYLDDAWVFGVSMPDTPAAGKIALLAEEGGAVTFSDVRVAEVEPLQARP